VERSPAITRRLPEAIGLHGFHAGEAGRWVASFALVFYLAVSGGGYDPVVHTETGIAIWWIVGVGAVTGVLAIRFGALGWAALALLGGFVLWTGLAMTWTESAERTASELARVATYGGALALGLLLAGGRSARPMMNGLACAFAAVAGLAVLSRLHPAWFPANDHADFLPEALNRLSYPLNTWNGLASFVAMGLPVLIGAALWARTKAGQAAAAAALPVMGLCIYLTASRGGAIAAGFGLVATLVVFRDRLAVLATLLTGGAGAAILIASAAQRDALERGEASALAAGQGDELLWLSVLVCGGVALLQVAIVLAARFARRPALFMPTPRRTAAIGGGVALLAALAFVVAGGPGALGDAWSEFKALPGEVAGSGPLTESTTRDVADRLSTVSGNGRWQYWQAAVDAMQTDPVRGIGPGAYEFWWARNATVPGFVRDSHSLYFDTLAETGIVGLVLLLALLGVALVGGTARTLRAGDPERLPLAAATVAVAVFAVAAAADWVWEVPAVPCALMLLIAVALAARSGDRAGRLPSRLGLGAVAVVAIVAVAIPLAGTSAVRESQADAADGRLGPALSAAASAERAQPYAASADLQRALVLELAGDLPRATAAAREASADEPTNWRTWLVRARLEAQAGEAQAAVDSYRRARSLNPLSPTLRAP
jgi:hypothetical protein